MEMEVGYLAPYIGPLAGVTTSFLWSLTALCFTAAGRRIGPARVNALRIMLAVVWLGLTHRALTGMWIPMATGRQVLLLGLSGFFGLTLGDLALFTAFVRIGPRVAMLVMTTAPIFAALLGWMAFGETLAGVAWLGMALTLAGVAWVVLERPAALDGTARAAWARGLLLATIAALCQAGGLWLSKAGIGHGWLPREQHMAAQTATLLRMFFAAVTVAPTFGWYVFRARLAASGTGKIVPSPARRRGYFLTFCGSIVGPYLGIWFSLVAADRAPLGVAQTTCSLSPVFILPFVVLIQKEHVSLRAVCGAVLAVAGVALLFWRPG
jgi:drug/metabolite transporter (DMT)-like permease